MARGQFPVRDGLECENESVAAAASDGGVDDYETRESRGDDARDDYFPDDGKSILLFVLAKLRDLGVLILE